MAPNNKRGSNSGRSGRRNTHHHKGSRSHHNPKRTTKYYGCGICKADHRLINCHKFNKMNLAEKYKTAVSLHYCVNCLARNHLIGKCPSKTRCQQCDGKHDSTLHGPNRILKNLLQDRSPPPTPAPRTQPIPAPRHSLATTPITTPITTSMAKTFVPTVVVQMIMESGNRDTSLKPFTIDNEVFVKVLIGPNLASNVRYEVARPGRMFTSVKN
ncbi:uncharacterized protein LOC124420322 isoform X2 [Lucilia cuprina]|uniref:uncharacterized protein LOC124420322 isoform X2 n=1 Tax=Lucilia cuprina TaxID=7375 RepID=UPI001F06C49C|nr:uncharacterized protein LOC124420322 isoform X2 [Lucilia cuprina]